MYHSARRSGTLREFVDARLLAARARAHPASLAIAALCLFGPSLLGGYWAWRDPGAGDAARAGRVPVRRASRGSRGEDWGISVDEQAAFSSEIFTNNIRVAILAFAGGILLGVGALFVLLYNGVILGATFGIAIGAGNGPPLFQQVLAHGVLELSCIVVAGAAGMRIGWAIIDPGTRPRGEALREEARAAAEMLLGTALLARARRPRRRLRHAVRAQPRDRARGRLRARCRCSGAACSGSAGTAAAAVHRRRAPVP